MDKDRKSMSDYIKEIEDLTKDHPIDKSVVHVLIALIEALQFATESNLEHIKGNSQVIGLILDVIENHKHCEKCEKMLISGARCSCNV